jgi:hypothetical protein
MNERIKELAKEAAREMNETGTYSEPKFQEKFAELIVKKCAKVAWYHTPDTEELEYSHLIGDKILKHFGVE